jgi:DNA-binding CsgD family transcriptional regulator
MTTDPASTTIPTATPTSRLIGRRREQVAINELLQAARDGTGGVLVLHGEPGVGKTALLADTAQAGSGFRTISAVGVEGEMELPFAALQQLCSPILELAERLPSLQQEALSVAFGLSAGPTPDAFLIGLATLGLLSEGAEAQPLLCMVDDAQWLDSASAKALTFAARRVLAEKIAVFFAARELDTGLAALPTLQLQPLGQNDARNLMRSVMPGPIDERVLERLVVETHGNPLAVVEFPRGLAPAQLAGGFALPAALPLTTRIEESFARRLDGLSTQARRLLLLASAEPTGDPALLWRAARTLDIPESAGQALEAEGLLALSDGVVFRHPLVRSAAYGSAEPEERRQTHRVLAEAIDPQLDPDRRAWHRAQAAVAPDEHVAVELERSAARAQARGGLAAAAAFLERAAALTVEPSRRAERALMAARANLYAGAFDEALRLLPMAEAGSSDELQRAQAELLRGQIAFSSGLGGDAAPLLLKAAERLEPLNLDLARETYLHAWGAAAFGARAGAGHLPEVCRAARALPPARKPVRPVDLLLDGLVLLITDGRAAAAPALREAASAFAGEEMSIDERLRWAWLATAASYAMWDNDGSRAISERQIELARDAGALEGLPLYLVALGVAVAWSGDFPAATSLIAEVDEVTAATGAHMPPFAALELLSLRGREAETSELIGAILEQSEDSRHGAAVIAAQRASAVLHNGLGRYEEALAAAQQASWDPLDLYPSMWALPELVEAAARSGNTEIARNALERLAATTQPAGSDFGLGIEARSRALLSEGEAAERLYREAIERLGRTQLRPELARAHLVYGEWLRRERRRADARTQLRTAHEQFTSIGMEAFAERARVELQATGERARKRTADMLDQLTSQEAQIAGLAADGHTNREIGAQLFISPSTVEYHLGKVFRKLHVKSRTELAHKLHQRTS